MSNDLTLLAVSRGKESTIELSSTVIVRRHLKRIMRNAFAIKSGNDCRVVLKTLIHQKNTCVYNKKAPVIHTRK